MTKNHEVVSDSETCLQIVLAGVTRTWEPVCFLTNGSGIGPADWAVARLIAAAPELLEALTHIRDAWRSNDSHGIREEIQRSFAAIAKATGESSERNPGDDSDHDNHYRS